MTHATPSAAVYPQRVVFCQEKTSPQTVGRILQFRKSKFVDTLGWPLDHDDFAERDEFDGPDTVHCGLIEDETVVGCFRAIRTDQPYLAAAKFPNLASSERYPRRPVSWEISRLGVLSGGRAFGRSINAYAAMFHFAIQMQAASLVAFCDCGHERLLQRIGIVTRRFGDPTVIGQDDTGREIKAVAGEIVMAAQDPKRLRLLLAPIQNMEIEDGAALFGRTSLSA